ncbi:hypothetical protein DFQ14_11084 [Halopolyspora algeriensis]|uniref:Uncharacterized protein n=1 Tax=Halopolyspora algeriensis TaxID=1500506 RepID=A0A368VKE1_9ACTN|nr:hypothetical protein DFQ14_11084 [Halopolyspora algeriensis]TQM53324.1 hypothetical protein FHU43_2714 [Halopolyspora algeriensis]
MEFIDTATIRFVQFTIVLVVWLAFTEVFKPPRVVRALRRWRATSRLRKELRQREAEPNTVVYWDRYRHLSKAELFAVAEEFGWRYSEQRIVPEGWALDFVRVGAAKVV